jgi:DNA-binding CsgD family transcriptional regulator
MELLAIAGFIDLTLGRYDAADRAFGELNVIAHDTGMLEPGLFRHHADAIEVKLGLGQVDAAAELLDDAQALADRLQRASLQLVVARSAALIEAARGQLDAAGGMLQAALADDASGQPFEHGRTLLALGSVQRRNRKKAPAREALTAAAERFGQLGAPLWADRAEAELARVGGRAPTDGLTPTERQVAELIAAGRTYREAAAELFISPKTVQWNLSKVYSKLGIRSRAELPGRLEEG